MAITKYASPAQLGAVFQFGGSGWIVADNEVSFNHGAGIAVADGARVEGNFVHSNGQIGVKASGEDVVVIGNEISNNNTAGFNSLWEAGGTKFVKTTNLVLRDNHVHHNDGPGLWPDINNQNTVIEGNVVEHNAGPGIRVEISYGAVIRDNTLRGNGSHWGGGIDIANSPDVEIANNELFDDGIWVIQEDRSGTPQGVTGPLGRYDVENLWVHDNTLTRPDKTTGLVVTTGDRSFITTRNNRFDRNTYVDIPEGELFRWGTSDLSSERWVDVGNDVNGSFVTTPATALDPG